MGMEEFDTSQVTASLQSGKEISSILVQNFVKFLTGRGQASQVAVDMQIAVIFIEHQQRELVGRDHEGFAVVISDELRGMESRADFFDHRV